MAVDPALQAVSQHRMVRADIGVITNVRLDHTAEMGPTLEEICELLQMTREEVDTQRQKGYIRFSVQNGITVYEITDILRLKNMLEMGKIYRKIDGMAITVPVKKETGNVTDSLTD